MRRTQIGHGKAMIAVAAAPLACLRVQHGETAAYARRLRDRGRQEGHPALSCWHVDCWFSINPDYLSHIEAVMYQSETFPKKRVNNELQLGSFITELRRVVALINADIKAEEERRHAFDHSSPTYPVLARQLRARRDNLLATISLLEGQRAPAAA